MLLDIFSWILIIIGCVFSIISAIGILRLPDVYTRMHAAGLGDTLALGAFGLGMMLQAGWTIFQSSGPHTAHSDSSAVVSPFRIPAALTGRRLPRSDAHS